MEKRKSLLMTLITVIGALLLSFFFMIAISGCFVGYYVDEEYPRVEEVYYVDVPVVPVYGVGVYYRIIPAYPDYYFYYSGYWYCSTVCYYRYYRIIWYEGGPCYFYGGHYVRITYTHYYYYDSGIRKWYYHPLPSHPKAYGTPPKFRQHSPKIRQHRSHPPSKAIPQSSSPSFSPPKLVKPISNVPNPPVNPPVKPSNKIVSQAGPSSVYNSPPSPSSSLVPKSPFLSKPAPVNNPKVQPQPFPLPPAGSFKPHSPLNIPRSHLQSQHPYLVPKANIPSVNPNSAKPLMKPPVHYKPIKKHH
jgi:hypothetical protein